MLWERCRPWLFMFVATLVMVGPQCLSTTRISALSYDSADSYIFLWNFWWTKTALFALESPYWTDLLYHPFGTSLAFHGYPLPYSLISVPIQLVLPGLTGLVVAFNLVVFLSFFLSVVGAYRLALHVTGNTAAALMAGFAFGFMPFHFLNTARLSVSAIEFIPFFILALCRITNEPGARRALALVGWFTACFYSSLEHALFLLLFSGVWVLHVLIGRRLTRPLLAYLGASALGFLVLAAPLLFPQAQTAFQIEERISVTRQIEEIAHWSPALASFLVPSRFHPIYGHWFAAAGEYPDPDAWGMRSETSLGLLLPAFALIGLFVTLRGRAFWGLSALFFLTLSLGPYLRVSGTWATGVPLPYMLLYQLLPVFRAGRDPTRIFPLAVLLLAIVAALGIRWVSERFRNERHRAVFATLVTLAILVETLPPWPEKLLPTVHPAYRAPTDATGEIAVMDLTGDLSALLAQTQHGKPLTFIWGLSLRAAPGFDSFELEADFLDPERVLGASAGDPASALASRREALGRQRIGFVIFPEDSVAARRIELARLLGARVDSWQGRVVCDFRGPD